MKKDYKETESVSIQKLGLLNGQVGHVVSSNEVGVKVDLGANGVWFFTYSEVSPLGKTPEKVHVDVKITQPEAGNKVENLTVATKPGKRPYKKRVAKAKEVKRAYNKKPKP